MTHQKHQSLKRFRLNELHGGSTIISTGIDGHLTANGLRWVLHGRDHNSVWNKTKDFASLKQPQKWEFPSWIFARSFPVGCDGWNREWFRTKGSSGLEQEMKAERKQSYYLGENKNISDQQVTAGCSDHILQIFLCAWIVPWRVTLKNRIYAVSGENNDKGKMWYGFL